MKIYIVMHAPIGDEDLPVFVYGRYFGDQTWLPDFYSNKPDAEDAAKRKAAEYPGEQFWVVEGEPTTAFSSQPVPVFEQKPAFGEI